jgi:hypothetical protein
MEVRRWIEGKSAKNVGTMHVRGLTLLQVTAESPSAKQSKINNIHGDLFIYRQTP